MKEELSESKPKEKDKKALRKATDKRTAKDAKTDLRKITSLKKIDVYHLKSEVIDYNGIKLVVPLPDEPYSEQEDHEEVKPDPLHVAVGG